MSGPAVAHKSELVATARREGLAAALDRMAPATLLCGSGGRGVATAAAVERAGGVVIGDRVYARADVAVTCRPLVGGPLVAVRAVALPSVPGEPVPAGRRAAIARALGYVRLGLALGLRDAAQEYLAGRTAGEVPLLQQQMVKGSLADATLDLLLARAQLDEGEPSVAASARIHGRITDAARTLLRLLGASGFVAGGPGSLAHHSELLENALINDEVPA
jgi:hypothetical protein